MDNATRFLNAYNVLDHSLRVQYNFKRSLPFADVVRRAVLLNSVVRKYEDDLVDFSRLRNAIVHTSTGEIMAEPNEKVVDKIEHIAYMISTPPRVLDTVCRKDVLCFGGDETLEKTIATIYKSGYSNIPVYSNGELIGVANGQKIINHLGEIISKGKDITEYIRTCNIKDIVKKDVSENYYHIAPSSITLEEALDLFYKNRKLLVILITKTGLLTEKPLGIVSTTDIMDINNILENY